jgi:ATP-dependent DNA helicase DinG
MISTIDQQPAGSGVDLIRQVEELFSPTGILSRAKNFEYRPQQQEMAVAVARALERREHLAVEAGTGVGKSLAYLVPAILFAIANKKKAVISTHTINLQEQLTQKDLPMLEAVLPVKFAFTMLKGRGNYLCSRRLHKAMMQASSLFTSPEVEELKRIYEWSKKTDDGSLSGFEIEPDMKVWSHVCSERGLCSPKICGYASDFAKDNGICFFQRARHKILSSDVLVLNHTLFFTLLPGVDEDQEGGILFKNDFVIFDEAHTVENVAAKHIGLSVSSGQLRYALNRLWNPRTEKGLLATLRQGAPVKLVADLLSESDKFFGEVENACEDLSQQQSEAEPRGRMDSKTSRTRQWTELRIRRPDLVGDNVTLPIQRLREAVSELIKGSEDKDTGQELLECNRRLAELREGVSMFLSQSAEEYVYWVERSGKAQKSVTLNAAPVDVAAYLRARLFGSDTSVIMTSATLAISAEVQSPKSKVQSRQPAPMMYFARKVGAEKATLLQVGSPFDYERQMKLFVARQEHRTFRAANSWQSIRALHQLPADAGGGGANAAGVRHARPGLFRPGHRDAALDDAGKIQGGHRFGAVWHGQLLAGRGCSGRGVVECHYHTAALRGSRPPADRGEDRSDRGAWREFLQRIFFARSDSEIPPGRRTFDSNEERHWHRSGARQSRAQ